MRFVAQLDISFHVFDDDDRVVHHNANRENQAEQRQGIQGKTEQQHDGKSSNEGNRKREQRDDGRAPRLQEDEHHDDDQDKRFDKSMSYCLNGLAYENRGVVNNAVVDAFRKAFLQAFHGFADLC